jgi:hypothetical protein
MGFAAELGLTPAYAQLEYDEDEDEDEDGDGWNDGDGDPCPGCSRKYKWVLRLFPTGTRATAQKLIFGFSHAGRMSSG